MRHALAFLSIAIALSFPPLARAEGPGPKIANVYSAKIAGAAFTTQALNAPKTFDAIDIGGYETVIVEVTYVYTNATHVLMTCLEGPTAAGAVIKVPEAVGAGLGFVTHYQRTWDWITGGVSSTFAFEVPVRYRWLTCTLSSTGGAAGDTATVTIRAQE